MTRTQDASVDTDPTTLPRLHELAAEVMDEIWARGEISVREVIEAPNGDVGKHRAYTTYLTIMGRLDGKGVLERRREGKTRQMARLSPAQRRSLQRLGRQA